MNVKRELAAVRRKVGRQIEAQVDEALIRLGFDPVEERRIAAEAARAAQLEAVRQAGEAFAASVREFAKAAEAALAPAVAYWRGFGEGLNR